MLITHPLPESSPLRDAIAVAYRADEAVCVKARLLESAVAPSALARIESQAGELVAEVRRRRTGTGGIDAFVSEYGLSSQEGVVLMCLAEALLRVPDGATVDRLIRDKIGGAAWDAHLGQSGSVFVNASTWALMLTGHLVAADDGPPWWQVLRRLLARTGEPVIRQAVVQAMRILGRQFVMGRTIGGAMARARDGEQRGYRYSFDMLGEAARTMEDADRYLAAYHHAITTIGATAGKNGSIAGPGISVKLSALHPRYEFAQRRRVLAELVPRLAGLSRRAADADIGLVVDAEEADRLELSLDVIEAISSDPSLRGWAGFGVAVQAYQKRAAPLIDWLVERARADRRRLIVRLVKGAYWDTEIKLAQVAGLDGYPVFTRKASTDISYLACARRLLAAPDAIYPAFATHNPLTLAWVLEAAGDNRDLEFQRLHGMGEALYDKLVGEGRADCRVYAPVGGHEELLAYLVRRLLENGANTSFINRIADDRLPIAQIVADPAARVAAYSHKPHPRVPLPARLYGEHRRNAEGVDLGDARVLAPLRLAMEEAARTEWRARPLPGAVATGGATMPVHDPADRRRIVGHVVDADASDVERAAMLASGAHAAWAATSAAERAQTLERAADLYEAHRAELMTLAVREAGRTVADAVSEMREAVDFLNYYAACARAEFAAPLALAGPTGERNEVALHGRGVFACISPWNFPLAIFTGQIAAALAAGNAVLAKPAEQTPLIAFRAVELLHQAGVPAEVLHLLPGDGATVGAALVTDRRVAGVAFTGSTETARAIAQSLAARDGPIVPLIAETGGQNAMIVDSTALPEQVTRDVLASAFNSAGQRCSALRVLYLQDDIAENMIAMIAGAMAELAVGDPSLLETDVGPVIDAEAQLMLEAHAARMEREGNLLALAKLGPDTGHGSFFAPCAFEIDAITRLEREVFGPILHVVRFAADRLDDVVDAINATGYGLTLGIHSRIDETVRRVAQRARVGNLYVNRNQIGAVVGVQPFGGEGLSGTGPKAGGPRYLHRFAVERAVSTDTTAAGGNAALLAMDEEG